MKRQILFCTSFFIMTFFCGAVSASEITPPSLSVYFGATLPYGNDYHNAACSESTGYIHPQVGGGTPPYTYLWSTGATTLDIDNIPAGTYTLTVHDAVNDSAVSSLNITGASVEFTFVAPPFYPCYNQTGGAVVYNTLSDYFNGTSPYSFSSTDGYFVNDYNAFSNSAVTGSYTLTQLGTNSVTVNVTDGAGCPGQETFSLPSTPVQNPTFTISPACNSQANGSVTVGNIVPSLTGNIGTAILNSSDTAYWVNCAYPAYGGPFTENNLAPGVYYLALAYESTNYNYCVGAPYYGCTEFFPFTIPDLGPNCGNVEGDVFVDLNANCTEDASDIGVPNTIVQFTPGPYYAYTNASGHYSTNLVWGNYNVTHFPPAALTQLCPSNPFPVSLSAINTTDTVNFADTSIIAFDVAAHISHGTAHPGFSFYYGVSASNLSYASSGMLTVTLNYDPLLSFVSSNPAPFSTSAGQVVWHLSAITNFQTTAATVILNVPVSTPLNTLLSASVNVQATTSETNLTNNTAATSHYITGPFDPNVKTVEAPAASFVPATDGLFNYTIQFQNTGNDTAINVEVLDTLDSDLDVTTFVPGASSHPYTIDLTGQGVIHFYFNNILLPDSTTDEMHSHGFVSFQIHSKANLPHGATVLNQSNIVFDFNPPVNTNTTINTVDLTLAVNASATTICAGQSVTLTMIPALQNTPWKWRAGNCSASIIGSGNSINVSPSVTTTYFVRDSAGTMPVGSCYRKTIIVNPLPSASITPSGPTTFCQGNSVTLTSNAANNYLWSNSSSSQGINVTSSGSYAVTVTNANNCTASSSAVIITVNPLPNASITPSGPTIFCQGNSVTLTSNAASSYLWSNSSAAQSINVTSSGNYVVTVTDANNCSSASPVTTVTVNPNPSVPNITLVFDSLVSDLANGYQWYFNSALIPGATTQGYHPTQNGNYSVVITDGNNCTASSTDYIFILTEITNPINTGEIFIYPNPAMNELVVRSTEFGDRSEITIYNLLGENLLSKKPLANSQQQVINVSGLHNGIYFVEVRNEHRISRAKFMKM
jgi:uncharacterized repeat protein (TIGR01451 family)